MTLAERIKATFKIWQTGTAPEGAWRPVAGASEFGNVFPIAFGNGWERGLSGNPQAINGMVYALVQCYVMALGASGLDIFTSNEKGGKTEVKSGANFNVLRYPNPAQNQIEFVSYLVAALMYTGNFYALAIRNGRNEIVELYPVDSRSKRAVMAEDGSVFYDMSNDYAFAKNGSLDYMYPARDVLHVKLPTSSDILHGETMIKYAAASATLNSSIIGNANAFNLNSSQASGVLTTEMALTSAQMIELRQRLEDVTKGANRGGVPILGGGLRWAQMSMSAQDAQMVEMYNMSVLDLCRIFRVPPQLLGMDKQGASSSVETLINQWRASGLLYFAELIESAFTRLFALTPNQEITFDLANIARADMKTTIDTLAVAVQNGIYSPDEARNKVGLDTVPFGESPRVQAQNVRLQDAVPAPAAPTAPVGGKEPKEPDDPKEPDEPKEPAPTKSAHHLAIEKLYLVEHLMKAIG